MDPVGGGGRAAASWSRQLLQNANVGGVLVGSRVLTVQRDLARPHVVVDCISQVNWSRLSSAGFRAVLLDKDNTITMPYEKELHSSVESALKDALAVFGRHNVAIISNSAGLHQFDPQGREADIVERELGLRVIRHAEKKPLGCIQDDIEKQFKCTPEEVIMVGDRILTDVVFGRRHGMFCILSVPLAWHKDRWAVQASRLIENQLAPPVSSVRGTGVMYVQDRLCLAPDA